jgi:hypothetical protein
MDMTAENPTPPALCIVPSDPVIGGIVTAVLSEHKLKVERYFWYSMAAKKSDSIRALAGEFDKYIPTRKLRGSRIGVTVHFEDGSTVTSDPTEPVKAPQLPGHAGNAQISPPTNIPKNTKLRSCKTLTYDSEKYPFRSIVSRYLGVSHDVPLEKLHEHFVAPKPNMKPEQHFKGIHDNADWSRDLTEE